MAARFAGLPRAHGRYEVKARDPKKNKVGGKAVTVHEEVTLQKWKDHLDGKTGLGIVPIRDDSTLRFAAIDVDVYTMDLNAFAKKVRDLNLPLIACRTKSGGTHLYLFGSEDLDATLARSKLAEWTIILGCPGSEIFPKQERLASQKDVGNWINMPYFDAEKTVRYAIHNDAALSLDDFLDMAERLAVTNKELREVEVSLGETVEQMLLEAPPCLQTIAAQGIPEGSRNKALLNFAIYAKKRWDEDWQQRVDEINNTFFIPPLGAKEVATTVKSVEKKNYVYTCKDEPICSTCQRPTCLTRRYGIKGGSDDPGCTFGSLVKIDTDPPIWIWDVDGHRLEINTEELMNQKLFQSVVLERTNKLIYPVDGPRWSNIIRDKLANLEVVEAPAEADKTGQLIDFLEEFCSTRDARSLDELLLGKAFSKDGRVFFRAKDFRKFLRNQGFNGLQDREVWAKLRTRGAGHHADRLKGKHTRYWSFNAFERQTKPFDVPEIEAEKEHF